MHKKAISKGIASFPLALMSALIPLSSFFSPKLCVLLLFSSWGFLPAVFFLNKKGSASRITLYMLVMSFFLIYKLHFMNTVMAYSIWCYISSSSQTCEATCESFCAQCKNCGDTPCSDNLCRTYSGNCVESGSFAYCESLSCAQGYYCTGLGTCSAGLCDSTWRCCSSTGDGGCSSSGNYRCQLTCDGDGECDYATNCQLCSTGCSDSDNGNYPKTAGHVTDYTGCSGGSCTSSTYRDKCGTGNVLTEYYCSGGAVASQNKDCDDYDGCSGSCPGCKYHDYKCVDSTDDYCGYDEKDPDSSSTYCTGCSLSWNIGGEVDGTACCGDDSGEYKRTRGCASGVCTNSSSDDACCDANTDCVYSSTCYGNGHVEDVDGDGYKERCSSGTWQDGEPPTSSITSPAENSWHRTDFSVSISDSDNGGSGLATCYYRVWSNNVLTKSDTTRTCSSSVTLTVGPTKDCRDQGYGKCKIEVWAVDGAGNEGAHVNRSFSIDWTAPTFDSYSVQGCDYDTGTDCWVKGGKTTYHIVRHYDGVSTPRQQYLTFTKSGCSPNGCGCSWDQLCTDGSEIKSSVLVDSGSFTDHMWNDDYLNIQSPTCIEAGGCTGTYAKENWTVVAGNHEVDYKIWTYLYDQAGNGVGYTYVNKWLKIDATPPSTSDNTDDNWHGADQTITLTCTDARSGCAATYYCVYDDGGTPCTPTTQGTSVSVTCPAGSVCKKRIRYYSVDHVGNAESVKDSTYAVKIDKQAPPTPSNVAPSDGKCVGSTSPTLDWSDVQDCANEGTSCSGLDHYGLQVDNNNDFSSPECTASPTSSSYSGCSLTSYVKYYWHVRAVDSAGNAGGYSSTWSFTTGDSACDGLSPGSCPSAGYICTLDCHYYDRDNAQSYCEDSTGCTPYVWMSGASQCCGDDGSSDTFANGTIGETCTYCSSGTPSTDNTIDSVTCTTCSSGYEYVDASDTCYYNVQCTSSGWSGSSVSCYNSGDIYDPDTGWIKDEGSWTATSPVVDGDERCYYLTGTQECDSSGCQTTYQTLSSVCTGVYYYDSVNHYFSCCSGSSCKHYTCNADNDGWDLISTNNPDDSQVECETHCNDEWDTGGTLCCGDETEGWCTTTGVCIYGTQVYHNTRPRLTDMDFPSVVTAGEYFTLDVTSTVTMNCIGLKSNGTLTCNWLGWSGTVARYNCSFDENQAYGTYYIRSFLDSTASDCDPTGDEGFDAGSSCTTCGSDGEGCSQFSYDYYQGNVVVKRPDGKPCTYGYECASGLCVDGYCRASCSGHDLKPCSDGTFAYSENKKLCWDPNQDNTLTCEPAVYVSDANYPKLYQGGLEVTDYFDVNDTVNYQNVLMAKTSSLSGVNTTIMDNGFMKYSSTYDYSSSSSTTQSQSFTVSGIGSHTFWTALFKPYYVVNESGLNNTKSVTRTADDLYVTISAVKKSGNDLVVYFTTNYMTGADRNVKTECWLNCDPGDADNSNNCPTTNNYCSYAGGSGSASCQMTSPTIQDSNTVYCVANDASFDPLDTDDVVATYSFGKVETALYLPPIPESDANNTITIQAHDDYDVDRIDYVSLKITQDGFVFLYDNLSIPNECVKIDANTMNCSINVTGLECGTYLINATAHNVNEFMDYDSDYMSVENLSIAVGTLNNSLIGSNHVLTVQVQYCLSDDYSGTTVKSYLDDQLLATNITDSSGKVEVGYTNPKTPGVYNLTVFAERGPLKDYKTIWYYVTDSELEMPLTSKVIKAGSTDQDDFQFTLTNPSSESATYQLKVIYSDIPAKFVYSGKDTMEITLNPGDSYTGYIDVIPSTVGSYTFWLQYNSLTTPYDNCTTTSPPTKNCPKMFTADVRAVFTVGLFSYSISPEMNVYSLFLLVLSSLIVLWRLKNF